MNRKPITLIVSALLALPLCMTSCGEPHAASASGTQAELAGPTAAQPAGQPVAEPDGKQLLARAQERWSYITNGDWIQTYDFLSPDRKALERLSVYLGGKEFHEYENPSKPALLAIEDGLGYIELTVEWTPHHPEIQVAANIPEASDGKNPLTQTLNMIETWEWVDGQWFWKAVARRNEFLEEHPKLARKP